MIDTTLQLDEARAQRTFRALLAALSYPGRPQPLPAAGRAALAAIGAALIDLETSYYCADVMLAGQLAFSSAHAEPPETARYQFFPSLDDSDLATISRAPLGSYLYPDEAATLVVGCALGRGQQLALRGPGISGSLALRVAGVPPAFWELRRQAIRYPLGWDLFLVAGDLVVGLPRTTSVEVC